MRSSLIQQAKMVIPPSEKLQVLLEEYSLGKVKDMSLEEALIWMDVEGLRLFEEHQDEAIRKLVELWLDQEASHLRTLYEKTINEGGWEKFRQEAVPTLADLAKYIQQLEKVLGNMRKARGGGGFQRNLLFLLRLNGIKAEIPTGEASKVLKRVDLVIPTAEVAMDRPDRAYFITCKRTLRERWKQEVPQAQANWRYYLITLDESISLSKAEEIHDMKLIAYVRREVKEKLGALAWIRPIDELLNDLR